MLENPYRNLTALVVDDTRVIRDFLRALLQNEGVGRILEAPDGATALTILQQPQQPVDIVFCDLAMPGMDGVETMRRIAAARLEPAITLISSYDAKVLHTVADMTQELGLRVLGTLNKPFTADDVSDILKEYLLTRRIHRSRQGFTVSVADLDQALRENWLDVYYQPKVRLSDGQLIGVEALARLQHPAFGTIDPDLFIPVAEASGRIVPLTMTVLQKAIAQGGEWARQGLALNIAINMSTLGTRRLDLPDVISDMAAQAGLPNERITLELTESQVTSGAEMLHIVSRFRLRGFQLAIDDYGTGQSGLQRLQRLPFTELKIDKAFVNGAHKDSDMRSILETSIELGKRLRMDVVAEGVESWNDWRLLKGLGCDLAQGYIASRPMPAAGIPIWAKSWSAPVA